MRHLDTRPPVHLHQRGTHCTYYTHDTPYGLCRDCGGIAHGYHNPATGDYHDTRCTGGHSIDNPDDIEASDALHHYIPTNPTNPSPEETLLLIDDYGDHQRLPATDQPHHLPDNWAEQHQIALNLIAHDFTPF